MDQIDKAIKQLSQDQMKTLLEDDEFFNDYFVGLPGVETLSTNVATIMKGLHSQAEENLKAKQQLETEIEQHDVLYSEYEALAREHEKLKAQKEKIMGKFSSANIVSAVKERKAEADTAYQTYEEKLASIEQEISDIIESAIAQGEAEKERRRKFEQKLIKKIVL